MHGTLECDIILRTGNPEFVSVAPRDIEIGHVPGSNEKERNKGGARHVTMCLLMGARFVPTSNLVVNERRVGGVKAVYHRVC
jgi:hypothetical protein